MGTWRIEKKTKTKGAYSVLVRGKGQDRVSVALRYVTVNEAENARQIMQAEEDAGTVSRILALHRKDPEAAIEHLVGGARLGDLLPAPDIDYGGLTLREYHTQVYAPWRKVDRPKTWRGERTSWARILRDLGDRRLRRIDAHIVADYLDALVIEREALGRVGAAVSGTTKRLHRAALQALLMRAERLRHIDRAPDLARFTIRGSTKTVRPKPPPLSLEELQRLLDASQPKHRAMWAVAVGEGLRPSELQRLRWEDVRWATRTLAVRGDDSGEGKTEASVAEIPLTPIAHRELRAWWMAMAQPKAGVVFPGKDGAPYSGVSGYKRALATAAKRAGIPHAVTPYLLRDSFATLAWSLGIDKDVARRILRHTDETMLDEVYCRPRPADLVAKVAAFEFTP